MKLIFRPKRIPDLIVLRNLCNSIKRNDIYISDGTDTALLSNFYDVLSLNKDSVFTITSEIVNDSEKELFESMKKLVLENGLSDSAKIGN